MPYLNRVVATCLQMVVSFNFWLLLLASALLLFVFLFMLLLFSLLIFTP